MKSGAYPVLAAGFLFLCLGVFPALAEAASRMQVDGLTFDSPADYVNSDYFRLAGKRCGTRAPSAADQLRGDSQSDCTTSLTVILDSYWPKAVSFTLPVVVHIIHKIDGTGDISDARVQDQIEVLNQDYRAMDGTLGALGFDAHIQFELAGITRTANDAWYNDQDEYGYKAALGWDQTRYVNIYVNTASGYLGYTYFPQENGGQVVDGITVMTEALSGRDGIYVPYNLGRTLVHEMGHFLGLYHTFQDGCVDGFDGGDLIVDTATEQTDHYGCTQTESCGTPDDIHNYMNYTDDSCMEHFTAQQANRMVCSLLNYRAAMAEVRLNGGPPLSLLLLN